MTVTVCKGGNAIAAWQKDNPEPEGGTLLGLEWSTPDNRRSVEEQTRSDLVDMYRRHGVPIPAELA